MVTRFGAAICGTAMLVVCTSAAMARTETGNAATGAENAAIVGAASMYNPTRPGGYKSGTGVTASGERYDPSAWTAAIQIKLRGRFGGVRRGKARYALVEGSGKRVIVRINDVGPLEPGRVIDFNRQTMRYFDPSLQRGLIHNVKVTPLPGDHYKPGPARIGLSEGKASHDARRAQGVRWTANRTHHVVG
jgi:rare lipoprotein A